MAYLSSSLATRLARRRGLSAVDHLDVSDSRTDEQTTVCDGEHMASLKAVERRCDGARGAVSSEVVPTKPANGWTAADDRLRAAFLIWLAAALGPGKKNSYRGTVAAWKLNQILGCITKANRSFNERVRFLARVSTILLAPCGSRLAITVCYSRPVL